MYCHSLRKPVSPASLEEENRSPLSSSGKPYALDLDDPPKKSTTKVPIVGYSGWYAGKVNGKIGKVEVHKSILSRRESEVQIANMTEYSLPPSRESSPKNNNVDFVCPKHDPKRKAFYDNCVNENTLLGRDSLAILSSIRTKLEFRFPTKRLRVFHVKSMFTSADPKRTGFCSEDHFFSCLRGLSIVLSHLEEIVLCAAFDSDCNGMVCYDRFLQEACPM